MRISDELKKEMEKTLKGEVEEAKTYLTKKWYIAWGALGFIVVACFILWVIFG
jgi:hypothetical protein